MNKNQFSSLTPDETDHILRVIKERFEQNMNRHENLNWQLVETKALSNPAKLQSLNIMERSGGEPDVVSLNGDSKQIVFIDCAKESPSGRRSLCYDRKAWEDRKKYKPEGSAEELANDMNVEILTFEEYQKLQTFGPFDTKTSSWLKTPTDIRKLGGAIFGDYRYGQVFLYHNGADSYYASRGFRAKLVL